LVGKLRGLLDLRSEDLESDLEMGLEDLENSASDLDMGLEHQETPPGERLDPAIVENRPEENSGKDVQPTQTAPNASHHSDPDHGNDSRGKGAEESSEEDAQPTRTATSAVNSLDSDNDHDSYSERAEIPKVYKAYAAYVEDEDEDERAEGRKAFEFEAAFGEDDDPKDHIYISDSDEDDHADGECDEFVAAELESKEDLTQDGDEGSSATRASTLERVLRAIYIASRPSCSCKRQSRSPPEECKL
jgi:hypothetical protein